jgi:hypothetical protein
MVISAHPSSLHDSHPQAISTYKLWAGNLSDFHDEQTVMQECRVVTNQEGWGVHTRGRYPGRCSDGVVVKIRLLVCHSHSSHMDTRASLVATSMLGQELAAYGIRPKKVRVAQRPEGSTNYVRSPIVCGCWSRASAEHNSRLSCSFGGFTST